jgi:hypothetical protein
MASVGLRVLAYPLQPSLVPYFDVTTMMPQDPMHNWGAGLTRYEGYYMCYTFCRTFKVNHHDLNMAKNSYPWATGKKPPDLTQYVESGAKGGVPTSDGKMHYSSSQMIRWAKASVEFLAPLVTDPDALFWKSWCAHVECIRLGERQVWSRDDIIRYDRALYDWRILFGKVYAGYEKLKHAFVMQSPLDITRNGPGSTYHCNAFEAFNKLPKSIAKSSNWKDECKKIATVCSLRSARGLRTGIPSLWGEDELTFSGDALQYTLDNALDADELISRFFGNVVASSDTIAVAPLAEVQHLGDPIVAGISWVLHSAVDLGFLDTSLARVGRLVAFTSSSGGMCDAVFIQLFRYPTIDVTSLTTMHAHVVVPTALLSSDELDEQEIFVHLPLHSIQVLHMHMSQHNFVFNLY